MGMIHEYFPEEWIELQKELASGLHPKLETILAECAPEDTDLKLAHIASYCEVMLDGEYSFEQRTELCEILRKKLVDKRERPGGIIILN